MDNGNSTQVVPETHFIHITRSAARVVYAPAVASWDARCSPVPEDADQWDDDSFLGVHGFDLYAFRPVVGDNIDIYKWSCGAWALWASQALVDEDDADNPEAPQTQSYYRIPA